MCIQTHACAYKTLFYILADLLLGVFFFKYGNIKQTFYSPYKKIRKKGNSNERKQKSAVENFVLKFRTGFKKKI